MKAKLIFFMQPFLKTMASFLQKLFLTTSSGITFCGEVEEPGGTSQVRFLEGLLLEAGERGKVVSRSLWNAGRAVSGTALVLWRYWELCSVLILSLKSRNGSEQQGSHFWSGTSKICSPPCFMPLENALCTLPILSGNISVKLQLFKRVKSVLVSNGAEKIQYCMFSWVLIVVQGLGGLWDEQIKSVWVFFANKN